MTYDKFVPQNVAPLGSRRIAIYNEQGNRVGQIPLGSLTPPNPSRKLYSFGALSDIHLQYDTAQNDFKVALEYLNGTEDVEFTCVCGDLTSNGTTSEFQVFKNYIDTYSAETPVYAIAGNHDATNVLEFDTMRPYTGQGLWYSFEHNGDVFIMVGEKAWDYTLPFSVEEMQWLYDTLETNRDKRCFVFQHLLSFDGCGNPYPGVNPTTDILGCENTTRFSNVPGRIFLSLMRHYKNCVWFHGHSHTAFECQEDNPMANYDQYYGIHSVHIPSLAVTREYENAEYVQRYSASEGYVVDVYPNGIHLRGRDFVKGEFLPIASYWLDTTLQTIPEGTYIDPTGTIHTGRYLNRVPLSTESDGVTIYNGGLGYIEGYRLSSSGALKAQDKSTAIGYIPAKPGDIIRMSGVQWGTSATVGYAYILFYDEKFTIVGYASRYMRQGNIGNNTISGVSGICSANQSRGIITDENGVTTFNVDFNEGSTFSYIRISTEGNGADMIVTVNEEIT